MQRKSDLPTILPTMKCALKEAGRGGSLQRALAEGSLLKQPVGLEHHGGVPECGAVLCAAQADKTFCNGPAVSIGNCADYDGARSIGERQ